MWRFAFGIAIIWLVSGWYVIAASDWDSGLLVSQESPVWGKIVHVVMPRIVVEHEGEYEFRGRSSGDGSRRLTISTDHLAAIRRFWRDDRYRSTRSHWPFLQTTLEWDLATHTYILQRIELGFFRKRIWLVHELPEAEDRFGSMSIQIKKEW